MDENKKGKTALKIIIWAIVILIFVGLYRRYSNELKVFKDPEEMKALILSFGNFSIIAFIVFQMIQVIIFFIPGEVVQIAGGYIFGPLLGGIVSVIGIMLGSVVAYYIAKVIGKKKINRIIEKKNLTKIKKILEAGSNNTVIFIIYFIPGIPKDILVYVAGISDINIGDFIFYSSMGRAPWIVASTLFGSGINEGNYVSLIIIAVLSISLFLVGIFKGHRIIDFFNKKSWRKKKKDLENKR